MVLFDIDGTLLRRSGPHHRQALIDAIRKTTGLETTTDGIPLHGMLDPDIVAAMLDCAGAPASLIRQALPVITRRAEEQYLRTCPNLERKTCPGARRALRELERRGVVLGLVTGNFTRIGWKKLECAGLKSHFRFGAFGEAAPNRAGLARAALREARRRGWVGPGTPVSLVGDSPADVLAAQANGIRSIAVLTGVCSEQELRACGPDLLLTDLRALKPVMVL